MTTLDHNLAGTPLDARIVDVGRVLGAALRGLLDALPEAGSGPQDLARRLGIDKVLASRLLKATRNRDPMAVVHLAPGPDPLRRVIRAAGRHGVGHDTVRVAEQAVARFEQLIRNEAGDRASLDAIISAWLPEARREFELRRKQAAHKAMSHMKGAAADVNLSTAILHPSDDGTHLDIVWVFGLLGLRRLRPGAKVKFASRRFGPDGSPRRPTTLEGEPVESLAGLRLDEFCDGPPALLEVHTAGNAVHYTLGDHGVGPRSAVDIVLGEANFNEVDRYIDPALGRRANIFAEVGTPAKTLLFDVLVHDDVYRGAEPELLIYDTALDGVADVNDRARDIDRLDLVESVSCLGRGPAVLRTSEVSSYVELVGHVCSRLGWDAETFRVYRCRIDYPVYGSQVVMAFDASPPERG